MFLSSHEIAQSRENALNNLLSLSAAGVEAGQRFFELISTNSRDALQHGISAAAIESVTLAEHEAHQATAIVATSKPATRKRAPAKRTGTSA